MLKFKFDYCSFWKKNGSFRSDNPLIDLIYYGIEKSLPSIIKRACPFPRGDYIFPNVTVGYNSLPSNQLMPTGTYKAFVNVSSKNQLWGYGWGTAEIKTPLMWGVDDL